MFYLTSYIIITLQDGRRLRVRPYSVKWKRSVKDLCDTCDITLPLHPYLYTTEPNQSSRVCLIKVDDPVSVSLGYNDNNSVRFIGFAAAVNYSERLVLQCEGYYHLIKRIGKDVSWKSVSLKKLLNFLAVGTDITLSKSIPDETLTNLTIQNASMDKVFKMLNDNYQCVAYFKGSELYCGPSYFPDRTATQVKKLRIGWNVKSGEVKNHPLAEVVNIVLKTTDDKGKTTKTKPSSIALGRASKYGAEVKLGNGQNGALSLTQVYIGSQKMEERVEAWKKQYAPRKVTIIEVDGKICALAPVTAQAVSQFATLAANPQGGLESASRMLLESQWIDGDDCLRDDDDYFITVMLQVQQLIELKKAMF